MSDLVESRISEWRASVGRSPAVAAGDADELEEHLREQIAELEAVGLSEDEALLVAVQRLGSVGGISAEYAREHADRLWKQLVVAPDDAGRRVPRRLATALALAAGAAVAVQVPRLLQDLTGWDPEMFYVRNAALLVLPFLAVYLGAGRALSGGQKVAAALPFVVAAVVANAYPWREGSSSELLLALHLPVVLWCAVGFAATGGRWRSHGARMDVVRFTGEWVVYYALIALGGGVLVGLTALILSPAGDGVVEEAVSWVVPCGAAGAVVVAAWLVEAKQSVVENMAPVLTAVFTPLFAVVLAAAAGVYAVTGLAGEFDRELLGVFDAMLVVVLGLVLYALSAQAPTRRPGVLDRVQLVAVASALVLDALVLAALLGRVGDLGPTPNRVAALGLNAVLLVDLVVAAVLALRFLAGRVTADRLARWQTAYLPVLAVWAAVVVLVLPPLFGFR